MKNAKIPNLELLFDNSNNHSDKWFTDKIKEDRAKEEAFKYFEESLLCRRPKESFSDAWKRYKEVNHV